MPKPPESIKPGSNKRTIQWGCRCKQKIKCFSGCGISNGTGEHRVCQHHYDRLLSCLDCNAGYTRACFEANWKHLAEEEQRKFQNSFLGHDLKVKPMDEATQMMLLAELDDDRLADAYSILLRKWILDMRYKVSALHFGARFTEDVLDWPQEELFEWYAELEAKSLALGEVVAEDNQH